MATNGISTHTPKSERRDLKLELAAIKRKGKVVTGDPVDTSAPYYRPYNVYNSPGTTSPDVGHPWELGPEV
jgi:hypothetical protein